MLGSFLISAFSFQISFFVACYASSPLFPEEVAAVAKRTTRVSGDGGKRKGEGRQGKDSSKVEDGGKHKKRVCYNCESSGHLARACPKPKKS